MLFSTLKIVFLLCAFFTTSLYATEPLKIVTSIPPLNALVAGITEGITQPVLLVPAGASHHHYALKPSARRALAEAQVVIWIGPEMEVFLNKPMSTLPPTTTIISILNLPELIRLPLRSDKNWEIHAHDHAEGQHSNANIDPHVWLDPQNAIYITQALTEHFSRLDAVHADRYKANANKMMKEIKNLDEKLKLELQPFKNKPFLVFHDAYQYFEHHYGLHAIGSISNNTDLPPSAQRVYQLQEKIKHDKIVCIFAEKGTAPTLVETLTKSTKTSVGVLDSVGQGDRFTDYLNLLQYDADQIKNCLN